MNQPNYQGSTAQQLIDFARENGVELPDGTSKNDAWAAVKVILADLGQTAPSELSAQVGSHDHGVKSSTSVAAVADKEPTHYTIQVSRPADVKLQDFVICANGTNYQIHFGKKVKVPAVVLNILKDAVERKPAYRDMETNEWIEESFEPRYSFAIHEEHFE